MKNIRFYEADKYKSANYEKIEDMIYKTIEEKDENQNFFALSLCENDELTSKLMKSDEWEHGSGKFIEDYMVITYKGRKYYRGIENIGTDDDDIFENPNDDSAEPNYIYVTSIVFVPEPELDENEPTDEFVSQYPLEDILEEFNIYSYDSYETENKSDKENSYVEFASDDIEDIRKVLTLIGKHVYNKDDGEYVQLIIE